MLKPVYIYTQCNINQQNYYFTYLIWHWTFCVLLLLWGTSFNGFQHARFQPFLLRILTFRKSKLSAAHSTWIVNNSMQACDKMLHKIENKIMCSIISSWYYIHLLHYQFHMMPNVHFCYPFLVRWYINISSSIISAISKTPQTF